MYIYECKKLEGKYVIQIYIYICICHSDIDIYLCSIQKNTDLEYKKIKKSNKIKYVIQIYTYICILSREILTWNTNI